MSAATVAIPNLNGVDLDKAEALTERIMSEQSLSAYIRLAWPVLEPDTPFLSNWHIDAMADHLTACVKGDIRRLIINIPPRYGKSFACSIAFPTWIWGPLERPGERFIFASYGEELVMDIANKRRALLDSEWYRRHWGRLVNFARGEDRMHHYTNTRRGSMYSTTMTRQGTGMGGNWIIVDDPHNTKQVTSKAERTAQIDFFRETLMRRLDDKFKGVIVVVMQRLAVDDLTGWILANLDGWTHLKIRGVATERETIVFHMSKTKHERESGELLWPEREGLKQIEEARKSLGERGFAGQYQQEPVPLGGAVFKAEWLRYYKALPRLSRILFSYDGAHKKGRENDYSVFSVWGIGEDHRVYLLEVWREREELPMLKRLMAALIIYWRWTAARWNTTLSAILVEDASSGTSIIQEFREPVRIDDQVRTILLKRLGYGGPLPERLDPNVAPPLLPIQVDRDKLARAEAVTPMIERGDMLLPDPEVFDAPWLGDYVRELLTFTGINDPHDDMVDATTQLLNHVRGLGSFNVMDFWRRSAQDADASKRRLCRNCRQPVQAGESYQRSGPNFVHVACPTNHANGNGVESPA